MKILFLIDTLEIGGTERSLLELCRRFRQTEAVVCHLYPGDRLKPDFEQSGARVISLELPGKYSFRRARRRVRALIQRERPDLLHASLFRSSLVGRLAAAEAGVPMVDSLVNDSYGRLRTQHLPAARRWKLRAVRVIDRWTAPRVFHFVANSEAVKRSSCSALGVSPERCSVIYRGRDPQTFLDLTDGEIAEARKLTGVGRMSPLLLNLGRLEHQKGQEGLLRAMDLVRRQRSDAQLLLVGDGPLRPRLEELLGDLSLGSHAHLFGWAEQPAPLLAACDLFVFPSRYEGFPGALVEAMLAGRPIVASDLPMHREAVEHQHSGLLVPPGSPEALAEGMLWMLDHPEDASRMGREAHRAAMSRFHIDRIAEQLEALYRKTLKAWRRG